MVKWMPKIPSLCYQSPTLFWMLHANYLWFLPVWFCDLPPWLLSNIWPTFSWHWSLSCSNLSSSPFCFLQRGKELGKSCWFDSNLLGVLECWPWQSYSLCSLWLQLWFPTSTLNLSYVSTMTLSTAWMCHWTDYFLPLNLVSLFLSPFFGSSSQTCCQTTSI